MDENIFERYETKYSMSRSQFEALFAFMKGRIHPDAFPVSEVCSLYLDTDDSILVRNSIEAVNYKEKLRLRSYGPARDDGMVFMEMKKKIDGIVYKRRISITYNQAMNYFEKGEMPNQSQIMREIDYSMHLYGKVRPKVLVIYDRLAYVSDDDPDIRITFDTNIRYRLKDLDMRHATKGEPVLDDDVVMLEIKSPGYIPIWLAHRMDELGIRKAKFSKYGTIYQNNREELNHEYLHSN